MPDLGPRLLSRLLPVSVAYAIAQQGALILTGYVTESADLLAAGVATDPDLLAVAFGVRDDPRYRDRDGAAYVLQFPYEGLMRLTPPHQRPHERRFPNGFLPVDDVIPVWWLERTRVPIGSVVYRLTPGAEPLAVAVYRSLARGWDGAQGFEGPRGLEGPRVEWQGSELPAALTTDGVEVASWEPLPGIRDSEKAPSGMWQAVLSRDQVDIFEVVLTATWRDVPVRVLASQDGQVRVLVEAESATAGALGATEVEPDVFEAMVPRAELSDVAGVRNELT